MEYTNNQINQMLESGILDALASIFGKEIVPRPVEKQSENPDLTPEPTYPLSVAELKSIGYLMSALEKEVEKFDEVGIDMESTPLYSAVMRLIKTLIGFIIDDDFSEIFMDNPWGDCEDIDGLIYNLIDYLNLRDGE